MQAYRQIDFPVTIVRPSHTYGERNIPVAIHGKKGSWQVVERIKNRKPVIVHGDGLSLWTFTHSSDFAKGFLGLMGNPHAIGEAVHITSDEVITWNRAYETIGRAIGIKPNIIHIPSDFLAAFNPELLGSLLGDKANCAVFDNSKIKRLVRANAQRKREKLGNGKSTGNRILQSLTNDSYIITIITNIRSGTRRKG